MGCAADGRKRAVRILSGVQPSGELHLGNYFGAADPAGAKWWQGWTSYAQN